MPSPAAVPSLRPYRFTEVQLVLITHKLKYFRCCECALSFLSILPVEVDDVGKKNRLKAILDEHGSTQTWLAKKSGVSVAAINDFVKEKKSPTLDTARKIAKALNRDVNDIWPIDE